MEEKFNFFKIQLYNSDLATNVLTDRAETWHEGAIYYRKTLKFQLIATKIR